MPALAPMKTCAATTRTHARTLMEQRGVGDRPAVVHRADARVFADDGVGEEDLAEHRVAGHLAQRTHLDARLVHVEREPTDALMLRHGRIRTGEQHAEIGEMTARRPDLLTVDDPHVAIADRARRKPREIRSGAGLTEQLAPAQPAGDCIGDVPLDLLAGSVRGDRRRHQADPHAHRRRERAELGDRLRDAAARRCG